MGVDFDKSENENILYSFNVKNRDKIIIQMLYTSIAFEMFDVSYMISRLFIHDLMKHTYLSLFDTLFIQFKKDTSKYEIKLALIENLMPIM